MKQPKPFGEHEAHGITISTDEYESMKATSKILSDPELMDQLTQSKKDIAAGRTRKWKDIPKDCGSGLYKPVHHSITSWHRRPQSVSG